MHVRPTQTRDSIVRGAIVFLDEHGVENLTLRSLGAALGVHHTAMYRHFRNKDELLQAVLNSVLSTAIADVSPLPEDPRDRIVAVAMAMRAMFRENKGLTTTIIGAGGALSRAYELQSAILSCLREMGVAEDGLVVRYQALESYVIGSCVYDFAGFPNNDEQRRARYASVGDPAMDAVSGTSEQISELTESAFVWGLSRLLDAIH